MKRNNKKGFTIVELVIVIAVIAILAAVLIPTFGGMIKKANDSATIQEANAAYKSYMAGVNYAGGEEPYKNLIVMVESDKYVVIKDGSLVSKVYETEATALAQGFAGNGTIVTETDDKGTDDTADDVTTNVTFQPSDSDCIITAVTVS